MTTAALTGRPMTGKSTIFSLLTGLEPSGENVLSYPLRPQRGQVDIPDARLERLCTAMDPDKCTPARIELIDLPGFSSDDDRKLKTAVMSELRKVDLVVMVVQTFRSAGERPAGELADLLDEFKLLDLRTIEDVLPEPEVQASIQDDERREKLDVLRECHHALLEDIPIREMDLSEREEKLIREFAFLSQKPFLVVANVDETEVGEGAETSDELLQLSEKADELGVELATVSAEVELEIEELPEGQRGEFLEEYGLQERGLHRFARAVLDELGLITFYTTVSGEVRAWTTPKGSTAPEAAGEIHSDMQESFIKAEVVPAVRVIELNGELRIAREQGDVRTEGKDYVVRDGDVMEINFGKRN